MNERAERGVEKLKFLLPKQPFEAAQKEARELPSENATFETKNVVFESSEGQITAHAQYKLEKIGSRRSRTKLTGLVFDTSSGASVNVLDFLPGKDILIKIGDVHAEHLHATREIVTTPIDTIADFMMLLHEEGHAQHLQEYPKEYADMCSVGKNNSVIRGVLGYMLRHEDGKLPETHVLPSTLKRLHSEMQTTERHSKLPIDLYYLLLSWQKMTWELSTMCLEREAAINSLNLLFKVGQAVGMRFSGVFPTAAVRKFDMSLKYFDRTQVRLQEILTNLYMAYRKNHVETTGGLWQSFNQIHQKIDDGLKINNPGLVGRLEKYQASDTVSP